MGFLKFVLIALLVYYGLLLAGRWLMPWLLRYIAKRTASHMEKTFGQFHRQQANSPDKTGNISWNAKPGKERKSDPTVGEYIEFEEIE